MQKRITYIQEKNKIDQEKKRWNPT